VVVETSFGVLPKLLDPGLIMSGAGERIQADDGSDVGNVPENRGKWGLEGTLLVYDRESGEDDVKCGKETGDCKDNLRNFVVDSKKEFDETSKKKEDSRVQQEGDVLNDQANLELFNAAEKECANSDAMGWRL
jgi:hypothetical protein